MRTPDQIRKHLEETEQSSKLVFENLQNRSEYDHEADAIVKAALKKLEDRMGRELLEYVRYGHSSKNIGESLRRMAFDLRAKKAAVLRAHAEQVKLHLEEELKRAEAAPSQPAAGSTPTGQ